MKCSQETIANDEDAKKEELESISKEKYVKRVWYNKKELPLLQKCYR